MERMKSGEREKCGSEKITADGYVPPDQPAVFKGLSTQKYRSEEDCGAKPAQGRSMMPKALANACPCNREAAGEKENSENPCLDGAQVTGDFGGVAAD